MRAKRFHLVVILCILWSMVGGPLVLAEDESTFIPTPANPSDLIEIEESEEGDESLEEGTTPSPPAEEAPSILDSSYLVFTAIQFSDQEELKAFIKQVEEDPNAQGQFEFQEEKNQDNTYVLRVKYTEQAVPEKQPILFYASTEFSTQEEAQNFAEEMLLLYPDLFFDKALIELANQKYDVVFGLRPGVSAQDITLNNRTISYYSTRKPYTYELEAGEEDRIEPAIHQAFPDAYQFERTDHEDGSATITMTPTIENGNQVDVYDDGRNLAPWQKMLERVVAPFGLTYRHAIIGLALLIAFIGVLIIVFK